MRWQRLSDPSEERLRTQKEEYEEKLKEKLQVQREEITATCDERLRVLTAVNEERLVALEEKVVPGGHAPFPFVRRPSSGTHGPHL